MNSVLDNEHSDLVVLNGDLISCENVAPDKFNAIIDQIVAPIVSHNLPFAATFGNHDYSETCSTRSMAAHMWWDIKGTTKPRFLALKSTGKESTLSTRKAPATRP